MLFWGAVGSSYVHLPNRVPALYVPPSPPYPHLVKLPVTETSELRQHVEPQVKEAVESEQPGVRGGEGQFEDTLGHSREVQLGRREAGEDEGGILTSMPCSKGRKRKKPGLGLNSSMEDQMTTEPLTDPLTHLSEGR